MNLNERLTAAERAILMLLKDGPRSRKQIVSGLAASPPPGVNRSDWHYAIRSALDDLAAGDQVTLRMEQVVPPAKEYPVRKVYALPAAAPAPASDARVWWVGGVAKAALEEYERRVRAAGVDGPPLLDPGENLYATVRAWLRGAPPPPEPYRTVIAAADAKWRERNRQRTGTNDPARQRSR